MQFGKASTIGVFFLIHFSLLSMQQPPLLDERGLIPLPPEFQGKPVYYLLTPCIKGISCGYYTLNNAIQLERRLNGQLAESVDEFMKACMREVRPNLLEGTRFEDRVKIAQRYSLAPLIHIQMIGGSVKLTPDYEYIKDPERKRIADTDDNYNMLKLWGIRNRFIEGFNNILHFQGHLKIGNEGHVILLSVVRHQDGTPGLYVFDNCNVSPAEHATLYTFIDFLLNSFILISPRDLPQMIKGAIKNRNIPLLNYLLSKPEAIALIKDPQSTYLRQATVNARNVYTSGSASLDVAQNLLSHEVFVPRDALNYRFFSDKSWCDSNQTKEILALLLKAGADPFYEGPLGTSTYISNKENAECKAYIESLLSPAQRQKLDAIRKAPAQSYSLKELIDKKVINRGDSNFFGTPINSLEGIQLLDHTFNERLSFSKTKISHIPANIFKDFTDLKSLSFQDNPLTSIDPQAFSGLGNLQELDLMNNHLSSIDPLVIKNILLSKNYNQKEKAPFRYLNLKGNPLSKENIEAIKKILPPGTTFKYDEPKGAVPPSISPSIKAQLSELQPATKSAPANKLETIATLIAQKREMGYSLKELIENKTIADLSPLSPSLSNALAKSHVVKINSLDGLQLFKNKEYYSAISFEDNVISLLSKKDFEGFTSITSLDFENNKISSIELGTFGTMPLLRQINLKNNNLTTFDPGLITGLEKLERLDLRGNRLSTENINALKQELPAKASLKVDQ